MNERELMEQAGDVTARRVFGEPVERSGVTLIPAARIGGGIGGGSGEGPEKEGSGSGFGYGFAASPAGAYVLRDGSVTWQPAVDVNRLLLGFQVIALAVVLAARAVLRARENHRPDAGDVPVDHGAGRWRRRAIRLAPAGRTRA